MGSRLPPSPQRTKGPAVVGLLTAVEAIDRDPKSSIVGRGDLFYHPDDAGWTTVYGAGSGWSCSDSGQTVMCGGGTGPLRVAPGTKGETDMLVEWDRGMLFRYDTGRWSCADLTATVVCTAR